MAEHDDTLPPEVDAAAEAAEAAEAGAAADAAPADTAPAAGIDADAAEPDAADADAAAPAAPPAKRFGFPWKTFVALVVFVVLAVPVFSTLQPSYYERYPQLRGRIDAWSKSTHARISCAQCHIDPGPVGFATFAAKSIPAFYSQLIWGPSEQNLLTVPNRAACQKCHTSYRQVSPAGDLLIPHKAHVEVLKVNCPTCHKNLVHSLNSQGYNKPEMQTCLTLCHNGTKATNQCDKCHTRKQVPPSHMAKDWLSVHPTMVGKINCAQCHAWSPNYCRECHSHRPPSHVENWKALHGARAKAIGTKGCLFCHGQAFCNKCH